MFEEAFDYADRAFAAMNRELRKVFTKEGIRMSTVHTTVLLNDGHVNIQGDIKSLTINGKLVRFKEKS